MSFRLIPLRPHILVTVLYGAKCASYAFLSLHQPMNTLILPDYIFTEANMPESQSQSLLLTKLPPELRLMIWDHALDACTLHFDCVDGRLQSVWCNDANDATKLGFRHACWNARRFISREGRRPIARKDSPTAQVRGRLSLLLTCKILYV